MIDKRQGYYQEGPFPVKLHHMLEAISGSELSQYASWDPEGRSFFIAYPKEFTHQIMGHFFNQTKYKSFQRQLNFYGFQRTCRGKIRGVCKFEMALDHLKLSVYRAAFSNNHDPILITTDSHPMFQRARPEMCNYMKRLDPRDHNKGTSSSSKTLRKRSSLHRQEVPSEVTTASHKTLQPTELYLFKPITKQSKQDYKSLYWLLFPQSTCLSSKFGIESINTETSSEGSNSDCDCSIGTIDVLPPMDPSWEDPSGEINEPFCDIDCNFSF